MRYEIVFAPAAVRDLYDVVEDSVEIIAVLPKSRAYEWLEKEGEEEGGST